MYSRSRHVYSRSRHECRPARRQGADISGTNYQLVWTISGPGRYLWDAAGRQRRRVRGPHGRSAACRVRPDNVRATAVDTSRRLLTRRRIGVHPVGAHGVPGRQRNEKPVSSMKTMAACFRRAFLPDPRPILFKPGPDHFLISLFGANGRDLGAPTRSPEPSGQVIAMVRDTELASDQITNPSQGPAIGPFNAPHYAFRRFLSPVSSHLFIWCH